MMVELNPQSLFGEKILLSAVHCGNYSNFGNFNSILPVDVIRVNSYVDSLRYATHVPVWVSINKLYCIPQ